LALPEIAFLTAFVLLAIPLNHAEWKTLGVGATSLRQTINEITALSLGTSLEVWGAAARVAMAVAGVAGATAAVGYWRRRDGALAALTGGSLALTLVVLMAAHRWLHTPFPMEGAIYLIPLTVLSVTALILKQNNRAAQIAFLVVSGALLACYVGEFRFGMYAAGSQFGGGRNLAKVLREQVGSAKVWVGASVEAEPIINYYRTRYRQGNWMRIERGPMTGVYDYYVLTPVDGGLVDERHLHVLYRDAGLTLAR
jgi:hypothetical protein